MTIDPENVLFTPDGQPIGVVFDGTYYRLAVDSKATPSPDTNIGDVGNLNASNVKINPATEDTLALLKAAIDLIKDTDGIKKITDALPTGDNTVGRIKLTDGTYVAAVDENGQLKVVTPAQSIPDELANFVDTELLNVASNDMRVDGSVTPVEFTYAPAGAGDVVNMTELRFVFAADEFKWETPFFGKEAGLTTGIDVKIKTKGVETTLRNIKENFDFLRLASTGGVHTELNGARQLMTVSLNVGGSIALQQSTADHVKVVINDDLDKGTHRQLTATIKGVKVA